MVYNHYLRSANDIVRDSLDDVYHGEYMKSWSKMIPARIAFLADAVVNAVSIPFSFLKMSFGALEALFTWGEEMENFHSGLRALDENVNRSIRSSIGAVVSPTLAYNLRDVNILFATAIALILCSPNVIYYSPNGGTGFAWVL